jgi:hypothetical protein
VPDEFVVHVIMKYLSNKYETFHMHYNTTVQYNWNLDQLKAQRVQEEEMLKSYKYDSLSYAKHKIKKNNYYYKQTFKK